MKKFELPLWFPFPTSWLNALVMLFLMGGLATIIRNYSNLHHHITNLADKPELLTIVLIVFLILPIPAIAFLHHLVLNRILPAIPGERAKKPKGLTPSLISWRESLHSWLVIVLSTMLAVLFCTPFLPVFQLNYAQIIFADNPLDKNFQAIFSFIWLISAAFFYQIEYLFKSRLVFGDVVNPEPEFTQHSVPKDVKSVNQQTEMSTTQTQTNEQPTQIATAEQTPVPKTTFIGSLAQHQQLPKKLFILILIPVTALWIYQFTNLPQVKQTLSTNLSLEKPLQIATNQVDDEIDNTYEKALEKAKIAANLTKSAQSQSEWKIVVNQWEEALELMRAVAPSSRDYALAQQKVIQYRVHLDFAKQNAVLTSD